MKSRLLRLLGLVLLAVTSINLYAQQTAGPADKPLSDGLNDKLPKWLRFSGEVRGRLEGFTGGKFKPNNDDLYFLSRIRLNMKVQPADWLGFAFQGQDAHVLGKNQNPAAPPYQDTMDLRLAYVQLFNADKSPATVRFGRQELAFGEERLIGSAEWLNTARSFDAVRGTIHRGNYRLDLFAGSVVKIHDGQFNEYVPGNYLYGAYAGLDKFVPKATVEPFFFWKRAPHLVQETGGFGVENFGTLGFRWVGKLPANFDYGTEIAKQSGLLGTDTIGAWAGHWVTGYTVSSGGLHPHVSAEYNYASGDNNPHDRVRGTFDQLYPTGHDKYGMADQVGWKNISNARAGLDLRPAKKWLIKSRYDAWWLADMHDALYDAAGNVVAKVPSGAAGRYVGQELDWSAVYEVTPQLKASGGLGHIFPGTFLKNATPGQSYNFPYTSLNLVF